MSMGQHDTGPYVHAQNCLLVIYILKDELQHRIDGPIQIATMYIKSFC